MGNNQSLDQTHRRDPLPSTKSSPNVSRLVIPLADGSYSTTPEVRSQLRHEIFGDASDETVREDAQLVPGYRPHRRTSEGRVDVQQWAKILHIEDGQQVDIAGLAVMLQELKKTATGEELSLLHQALLPSTTTSGYSTPLNPTTPARDNETFEYRGDVIRRRSLFAPAPGTATRTSTQKLKKQQPQQPATKVTPTGKKKPSSTWSPEDFVSSPLSKLAGMEPGTSALSTPMPRPATPMDLECANLGTHILGSLRITNASPDPSVRSAPSPRRSRVNMKAQEDYFNCVDGNGSASGGASGASPGNMLTDDSKSTLSSVDMPATPTSHSQEHSNKTAKVPIADRREVHSEPRPSAPARQFSFTPDPAGPLSLYLTEASSNPYLSAAGDESQDDSPDYFASAPILSHDNDPKEIPPTPAETESIYSSRSRPTSPRSFVEQSRNDAFSALNGTSTGSRAPPKLSPLPSYLEASVDKANRYAPRHRPHQEPYGQIESCESPPTRGRLPPPVPQTAWVQETNNEPLQATPTKREELEKRMVVPELASGNNIIANTPPSSPHDRPKLTKSATSEVQSVPVNGKTKPNKLQRKRAKSARDLRDFIIVQSPKLVDNVPSVPTQVASGYAKRMSSNPNMEHLEHTYDSVSASEKRSLDLQPPETSPLRFPSPSRDRERSSSRGRKALHRISRGNMKRRKSNDYGIDTADEIVNITEFGTVTESLGSSPYDAASQRPRHRSSMDMSSPHQITSRRERPAKSTRHGMDERAASDYAHRKSRDRLANLADADSRLQSPGRNVDTDEPWSSELPRDEDVPPMPSIPRRRPKSYQNLPDSSLKSPAVDAGSARSRLSWPFPEPEPQHEAIGTNVQKVSDPDGRNDEEALAMATKQNTAVNALPPKTEPPSQHDLNKGWEAQAQLWRQRRKSIGEGLGLSTEAESEPRVEKRATTMPRPPTPHTNAASKDVKSPTDSHAQAVPAEIVTKLVRGGKSAIGVLPGPFQGLPPEATEQPLHFRPLSKSPTRQTDSAPTTPQKTTHQKVDSPSSIAKTPSPSKSSTSRTVLGKVPALPQPSPNGSATTGSRSPSPTVRERAAMFDRVEQNERGVELARIEAARRATLGVETKAGLLSGYCVNGR